MRREKGEGGVCTSRIVKPEPCIEAKKNQKKKNISSTKEQRISFSRCI